jgi:protoporphyrinogen oxidase
MNSKRKKVVIIGAGPAGLTAAFELSKDDRFEIIVLEKSNEIGGLSRTVNYKGFRMDIGGHRFFSKSDVVLRWWEQFMPAENVALGQEIDLTYQGKTTSFTFSQQNSTDVNNMMIRTRRSRILFLRTFFDYPLKFDFTSFKKFGIIRLTRILMSYLFSKFSFNKAKNLEEFFIKRFGSELYKIFFKSYTEKVWGVRCHEISAEWGEQRIKKLSITKAFIHLFKSKRETVSQKNIETSLIEQFLYPKLGPGQMWELVAEECKKNGVKIIFNSCVKGFSRNEYHLNEVYFTSQGIENKIDQIDYALSTMSVQELIKGMNEVPKNIQIIAQGLIYRDFITVGVLVRKDKTMLANKKDNWIYIQESDVQLARLQIFNNWSPFLVPDDDFLWLGLEYFCYKNDSLWDLTNQEMISLCETELLKLNLIEVNSIEDFHVVRQEKSYPAYFGSYKDFDEIRTFTDKFSNLFLIGRNGMHRYNNQDHSMLTAIEACKQIKEGVFDKDKIWNINTEQEYHEGS